jgi:hypothetical protein
VLIINGASLGLWLYGFYLEFDPWFASQHFFSRYESSYSQIPPLRCFCVERSSGSSVFCWLVRGSRELERSPRLFQPLVSTELAMLHYCEYSRFPAAIISPSRYLFLHFA